MPHSRMKRNFIRTTCLALLMVGVMMLSVLMNNAGASSYESITRQIEPADDWHQIVNNSAFQLGSISTDSVHQDYGSYPSIDGSTVAVPMAMEFARQHLGLSGDDLYSFVFFTTTHNAYMNLFNKQSNTASKIMSEMVIMDPGHPIDIVICTEPSDDERATAIAAGVELSEHAVALDAFVFITHADNPVNSLTVEQIQEIYGGIIKNWNEVGGNDAKIIPYQRPANSGSQTAMENLVMKGEPLEAALPNYITSGMEGMVQVIGDYENNGAALGYTYLYYLNELIDNGSIKVLHVDGVAASAENIRSGAYPFSTAYYAVYRAEDEGATAGEFTRWILSDEGQACVKQAGYIPVKAVE